MVVAAVATLAGADGWTALRLGAAMTSLQASIGALNDVVDAPSDAAGKPAKPIPAGLVSPALGRAVAAAAAITGVVLAAPAGAATVILAVVVLGIGYGYDLRFKGTAWSWVPFALGIPLLPVFGWLGAAGSLPGFFWVLLPVAVLAGTALAIANARVDVERDAAAGLDSVAVRLGLERAWVVHAVLLALVVGAALLTLAAAGAPMATLLGAAGAGLIAALGAVVGRAGASTRRERAWEIEALGVAALASAWLAGVAQ